MRANKTLLGEQNLARYFLLRIFPATVKCNRPFIFFPYISYRVMETMPRGSPRHMKPREVAQGDLSVLDGQEVQHDILGLSPGKVRLCP